MYQNWRISSVSGALVAGYFIPAWTNGAFRIMVSPMQGLYERPNISMALYLTDYLHMATMSTIRFAWLLAVGKLTVVAFLTVFLAFTTRASIRRSGGCDEALAMAIGIGGVITFAGMIMASRTGQTAALHLHVTELLLLLSTAILLAVEPPKTSTTADNQAWTTRNHQSVSKPSS